MKERMLTKYEIERLKINSRVRIGNVVTTVASWRPGQGFRTDHAFIDARGKSSQYYNINPNTTSCDIDLVPVYRL
jgi:hypothetical protein